MIKKEKIWGTLIATTLALTLSAQIKIGSQAYFVVDEYDYDRCYSPTVDINKSNDGVTTYYNKANGKSYTVNPDGTTIGDNDYNLVSGEPLKRYTIDSNEYTNIQIPLGFEKKMKNLRVVSGKKNIKVKILSERIYKNVQKTISYDDDTKRYFYRDSVTGQKIFVADGVTSVQVNESSYEIRVYGKKLGKAKIKYDITDFNGKKIGEKTISFNVTDDKSTIESATFGGKDLIFYQTNPKKYIYAGQGKSGLSYTTMKKGKFKIKLDKDHSIVAIYVKKPNRFIQKAYDNTYSGVGTFMGHEYKAVDLNGDGDCNDVINGIEEEPDSIWTYTKIKNGQKVVLSNVPDELQNIDYTVSRKGTYEDYRYTYNEKSNLATTEIIVVFKNKMSGYHYTASFKIKRRTSKKFGI